MVEWLASFPAMSRGAAITSEFKPNLMVRHAVSSPEFRDQAPASSARWRHYCGRFVMHRRRALTIVPLIVSLLAAGCGSATTQEPSPASTHSTQAGEAAYRTPPKPARPTLAKVEASGMLPADTFKLASPLGEFGLALLSQEARANPTGNIVLSPTSIQDALVMTLNGARGETATQMQKALGLQESQPAAGRSELGRPDRLHAGQDRRPDPHRQLALAASRCHL